LQWPQGQNEGMYTCVVTKVVLFIWYMSLQYILLWQYWCDATDILSYWRGWKFSFWKLCECKKSAWIHQQYSECQIHNWSCTCDVAGFQLQWWILPRIFVWKINNSMFVVGHFYGVVQFHSSNDHCWPLAVLDFCSGEWFYSIIFLFSSARKTAGNYT